MQNNKFIGYFLEDLAEEKIKWEQTRSESVILLNNKDSNIGIIKEEKKESSDESIIDSESDINYDNLDTSPLNSQDEISFDEEDEYSLPESYRFYSERIAETE